MPTVRAEALVPGPRAEAEALFYDLRRWPAFVDGFGAVAKVDGDWPEAGSRVLWDSKPGGRGRVSEVVASHRAGEGQVVEVDDERLRATQTVSFAKQGEGVRIVVSWEYELKDVGFPASLFVRRALGDSLRRTVLRYRVERMSDVDDTRQT